MTVTIPTNDAVWVAGDLYCKTPEALEIALETLRTTGYTVTDQRIDGYSIKEGRTTPEQMEQNGWSLWYARLEDIDRGKCKSCQSYISRQGIRMHGHTCEACGEVTFYEMVEGSTISFRFVSTEHGWFDPYLRMTVKRWDTDGGWLYLRREIEPAGWAMMTPEQAEVYLDEHCDKWELVDEDGQQLIKLRFHMRHFGDPVDDQTVIEPRDIFGHHINYDEVKVWEGKEYSQYAFGDKRLPISESISVYESWHWAPLEASPTLHERIIRAVHHVSDAGYYYQDGRPAWSRRSYEDMGVFVRHFTTLDADKWDRESFRFRLDGPCGIADVARFCHPDAVVENQPNIGNFLVGVNKLMSGDTLVGDETAAFKAAVESDPTTQDFMRRMNRRRSE